MWILISSLNNDFNQAWGNDDAFIISLEKAVFPHLSKRRSDVFYRFYCLDFDFITKITCFMMTMNDEI